MKRWINILSNVVFTILLVVLIYRFASSYFQNSKLEGSKVPPFTLTKLIFNPDISEQVILGSNIKPPYVIIFWSSSCPPCLVELSRFDQAIKDGEIPKDKFIAIDSGENLQSIKKFMQRKDYNFTVFQDNNYNIERFFNVTATPLVVHVDKDGLVTWISTGVSPTGIIRAKKLLQ